MSDTCSSDCDGFECDEVDFAICCLALCEYSSYDMVDGEIRIVGQA